MYYDEISHKHRRCIEKSSKYTAVCLVFSLLFILFLWTVSVCYIIINSRIMNNLASELYGSSYIAINHTEKYIIVDLELSGFIHEYNRNIQKIADIAISSSRSKTLLSYLCVTKHYVDRFQANPKMKEEFERRVKYLEKYINDSYFKPTNMSCTFSK